MRRRIIKQLLHRCRLKALLRIVHAEQPFYRILMDAKLLYYLTPLVLMIFWTLASRRRAEFTNAAQLQENRNAGLTEPASLHPVIDPLKCMGCGSCVSACPEGGVLGLIRGKAHLMPGVLF